MFEAGFLDPVSSGLRRLLSGLRFDNFERLSITVTRVQIS
jgi:hypothetical protein